MLGLGWTEMFVVGVVALIVIGPKELPELMRKLGRFAGTVRRMGSDFQRELNRTTGLEEVKNLRSAITQPLKETSDAIRREFNTTTSSGKVEPSGAIKPADPKSESVANEIRQKAGLPFTPAAAAAMASAATAEAAAEESKGKTKAKAKTASKRAPKAKAAPTSPVATADLPPAEAATSPAPAKAAPKSTPAKTAKPKTRTTRKTETAKTTETAKPKAKSARKKAKAAKPRAEAAKPKAEMAMPGAETAMKKASDG